MAEGKSKIGVFEAANRLSTNVLTKDDVTVAVQQLAAHENEGKTDAHIIDNIFGLSQLLDQKQGVISGYTGTFEVVTAVDFETSTTTTSTITVTNGVIVSVT